MTTMAYKNGVIAYDSRVCQGDRILSDSAQKMVCVDDNWIIWAGVHDEEKEILKHLISDVYPENLNHGGGFAMIDKVFYCCGLNSEGIWKIPAWNGASHGSGASYAIGAMDAGASAIKAVKIAIGRDINSGGTIRTIQIKHKPNARLP